MANMKGTSCQGASVSSALLKKWEQLFHFNDINNDNLWSLKDLEIIKEKLMKNANLTTTKCADVTNMMHDMWVENLGADLTETLTLDQFLTKMKLLYLSGKMPNAVKTIRTRAFYCCDLDGDGLIDFNEYKTVDMAVGRSDMPYIKQAFQEIDKNHDGKISLEEYVAAFVRYTCDPLHEMGAMPLFGLPNPKE